MAFKLVARDAREALLPLRECPKGNCWAPVSVLTERRLWLLTDSVEADMCFDMFSFPSEVVELTVISLFLYLCFITLRFLPVRLSSRGFMSGGRAEILRKTMIKYKSSPQLSKCKPAITAAPMKVTSSSKSVPLCVSKTEVSRQFPASILPLAPYCGTGS